MSYQRFSAEQSARLADNVSKQPASSWSFLPFSLFSPYRFFLDFIHSKCYGNRSPSRRYSQIVPLRSRTRPNDFASSCLVDHGFLARLKLSSITRYPPNDHRRRIVGERKVFRRYLHSILSHSSQEAFSRSNPSQTQPGRTAQLWRDGELEG